jgi:hypothetical protein
MDKFYKCPKCQHTLVYGINPCPACKSSLEWSEQSGPKLIIPSNVQPAKAAPQPDKPGVPDKAATQADRTTAKLVKKSVPVWAIALIVIIVLACIGGLFVGLSHSSSQPSTSPATPAATTAPKTTTTPSASTPAEATTFIGNENSKIFHYPSCRLVGELKSSNKVVFQSYSEAISQGYKPCGVCKPH